MAYSPTKIMSFDIDAQEKILKPSLIQDNLENVSRETKVLGDNIKLNKEELISNKDAISYNGQSFRKLFLDL